MANPEHVAIVKQGAAAIAAWRAQQSSYVMLDLAGTDFGGANLSGSDLSGANLRDANLAGTDLHRANLFMALLIGADLTGANLLGAKLLGTILFNADFRGCTLFGADFTIAAFDGTALAGAWCSKTSFADCNLNGCTGLEQINHHGESSIGVDTLVRTLRGSGGQFTPEQFTFFRNAGVPQELLDALPRLMAEVKYHTAFISYGQPNAEFAQRLYQDLQREGVSCWLYEMDATPGERTWREIIQRRREAEKFVMLCSVAALVRDGVLKEIEEQIDENPSKLVPISLDNLWKEPGFRIMRGNRDLKPFLLDRNYADFANLEYQEALQRLLAGLRRKET